MQDFKDITIAITGSAHGLGKAIAVEFYKLGSHLALIDIDQNGLELLKSELANENQLISIHVADVSNEEQIVSTKEEILFLHKKLDILINNAGVSISQPFEQMSLSDYKNLFDINFWGTVYCTKHFLSALKLQSESKIINIISNFANIGFPGKTAYGSSKAAILAFTNSLYTELSDTNIKLSYVIPPAIKTGIILHGKHINEDKMIRESLYLEKNGLAAEVVAQRIISQLRKDKFRIVIGNKTYWLDLMARLFPTFLIRTLIKNKKKFDFI